MNTHINDFDTFMSLAALNAKIIDPENMTFQVIQAPAATITEKGSEISTRSKTRVGKVRKNQIVNYIDYTKENNVLIAIQNNEKFLKMIKFISKQIEPSMYLYTEDDSIVCIISSNAYYPIIISRFIVQEPHIYVKSGIMLCIQFPYKIITSFISKNEKQLSNYTMLVVQDQNQLKIEYHNGDHTQKDSTQNFKLMTNKSDIYETEFRDKMIDTENPIFDPLIESSIDYYDKFQCMKLLFLSDINTDNILNTNKTTKSEIAQYLVTVSEDKVIIDIKSNKKSSNVILGDRKPMMKGECDLGQSKEITSVLYWNSEFINKKIRLLDYNNIFKRIDRLPNSNDRFYYGICKYDVIPDVNIYALIKIISNKNIKEIVNQNVTSPESQHYGSSIDLYSAVMVNEAPTFGNIFNNTDYICEFTIGLED